MSLTKRIIITILTVILVVSTFVVTTYADVSSHGEYVNLSKDPYDLLAYVDQQVRSLTNNLQHDYIFFPMYSRTEELYYLIDFGYADADIPMFVTWDIQNSHTVNNVFSVYQSITDGIRNVTVYLINPATESTEVVLTRSPQDPKPTNKFQFDTSGVLMLNALSSNITLFSGGQKSIVDSMGELLSQRYWDQNDMFTLADIDFMLHNKQNVSDTIGGYLWYTSEEYHDMEVKYVATKRLLSAEQLNALQEYQRGLADGRSDVSSIGNGIKGLFGNVYDGMNTILDFGLGNFTVRNVLVVGSILILVYAFIVIGIKIKSGG